MEIWRPKRVRGRNSVACRAGVWIGAAGGRKKFYPSMDGQERKNAAAGNMQAARQLLSP
jgi:hypothetical protein